MAEIELKGCSPEPLMSYLKALGVFRLVAVDKQHGDSNARLAWQRGVATLQTKLTRNELTEFFLQKYRPTPILAPWNGGSGFYGGGSAPLEAIGNSNSERLESYRQAITTIKAHVPNAKPKDEEKDSLLVRCRAELPDEVVAWLDVCFVLGDRGPSFFPLLGTGGNDGRLDFTNNFMQRLAEVIPLDGDASPSESSRLLLNSALFADSLASLGKTAIGQFNPGGIGGANGTQGSFEANSRVNAWDFVLMIEGSLLFAGSVARRLNANSNLRATFPFSVDSVAVGYGSATGSEETTDGSRAELWLPLWDAPCTLGEVQNLFAEGRAQLGRRQAKNAVEFALAANLLGVNRGITAFSRIGFLKRNGLAFLATPLGRVAVEHRPKSRLLADPALLDWIERLRRACSDKAKTPSRYLTALRQIDATIFGFANRSEAGNDAPYLIDVLVALGKAERTLSNGMRFAKDNRLRPLQGLSPEWLTRADDHSAEFRLSAATAGIRAVRDSVGPLRSFIEPVEVTNFVSWAEGSSSSVWSNRSLAANLSALFRRRQMEAFRDGLNHVPLKSPRLAPLGDVLDFLHCQTSDEKLTALLWALTALDWSKVEMRLPNMPTLSVGIPIEFGAPRLLVEPLALMEVDNRWRFGGTNEPTTPDPDVFHILASGQQNCMTLAVDRAAKRLKSGGRIVNGFRNRQQAARPAVVMSQFDPNRVLAAMLFPLAYYDLERIANAILFSSDEPENEE